MNVKTLYIASLPDKKMSFPKYKAKIHIISFLEKLLSMNNFTNFAENNIQYGKN